MRITSNTFAKSFLASTQRSQSELLQTQLQMATGRRVIHPSDDPGAAVRIDALNRSLSVHEGYQDNAEAARRRLSIEETALGRVTDTLNRMRELTVRANTASMDDESRAAIAAEVRQLAEGLVQLANSEDGTGGYLFGGFRSDQPPFAVAGDDVLYKGDQGRRHLQIGETRSVVDGDPGDLVFMAVAPGRDGVLVTAGAANTGTAVAGAYGVDGPPPASALTLSFSTASTWQATDDVGTVVASGSYTPGDTLDVAGVSLPLSGTPAAGDSFRIDPGVRTSVFEIANDLVAALETTGNDARASAQRQNGFAAALSALDGALGRISNVRTDVGARLSAAEEQRDINEGFRLELETTLSSIRDLDYAEAISRLERQLAGLEAAQQSFARARQLSLFDFI